MEQSSRRLAITLIWLTSACGGDRATNLDENEGAVVNGTDLERAETGIGLARVAGTSGFCSAVLICSTTKGTVGLSAGHCGTLDWFTTEPVVSDVANFECSATNHCAKIERQWQSRQLYKFSNGVRERLLAFKLKKAEATAAGFNGYTFYPLATSNPLSAGDEGVILGYGTDSETNVMSGLGTLRRGSLPYVGVVDVGDHFAPGDDVYGKMMTFEKTTEDKSLAAPGDSGGLWRTADTLKAIGIQSGWKTANPPANAADIVIPIWDNMAFIQSHINDVCLGRRPLFVNVAMDATAKAEVGAAFPNARLAVRSMMDGLDCKFTLSSTGSAFSANAGEPSITGQCGRNFPTTSDYASLSAKIYHNMSGLEITQNFKYDWVCRNEVDDPSEATRQIASSSDFTGIFLSGRKKTCTLTILGKPGAKVVTQVQPSASLAMIYGGGTLLGTAIACGTQCTTWVHHGGSMLLSNMFYTATSCTWQADCGCATPSINASCTIAPSSPTTAVTCTLRCSSNTPDAGVAPLDTGVVAPPDTGVVAPAPGAGTDGGAPRP